MSALLVVLLSVTPPSAEERAHFEGSAEDPAPEKLLATRADLEDRHYLSGDEANLQLFYPQVKDLGGGYAGVGSDQAYLFIGWQRPSFAWLTDYDPWIKRLHLSYAAFFAASPDIASFRAWWKDPKAAKKKLKEVYADRKDLRKILIVFHSAHYKVNRRLRRLSKKMKDKGVPSFVTDEAQYQFVREMVGKGRVRPMLCNLLDSKCLVGIGEAGRKMKVPLRVLYTSNAEQYWKYGDQFRANMKALHWDEKSLILRTLATKPSANKDYQYNTHKALNFVAFMEHAWMKRVRQLVPFVYIKDAEHIPLTHLDIEPEAWRAEQKAKAEKKKRKKKRRKKKKAK